MAITLEVLRLIKKRRPQCAVVENVMGISEVAPGDQKAPLEFVLQELLDACYSCDYILVSLGDWHAVNRQRTASSVQAASKHAS